MASLPNPQKATPSLAKCPTADAYRILEARPLKLAGKGVFFDEHIDLADPVGTKLLDRALETLDAAEKRKRKPTTRAREAHCLRVRKILANAMRAYFFREVPAVLYFAKADAPQYENKPNYMKHGKLGDTVEALTKVGLLIRITGKKMPRNSKTDSWASSFFPSDRLIALASLCRVRKELVEFRLSSEDLVQLYPPKKKRYFDPIRWELVQPKRGEQIQFEPTSETKEWTERLLSLRAFYDVQEIALGISDAKLEECLAEMNADKDRIGTPYRLPEIFKNQPYRVFNNGHPEAPSFEEGGRLFGCWWMQLPEEVRQHIRINGRPVVEIDFKACHPSMLYHQRGIDVQGDIYSIPEVSNLEIEAGLPADTYRPFIKALVQVLLNGRGRPEATEDLDVPEGLDVKQCVKWIEDRHSKIADAFRTGAGLYLMRLESDIALEIVTTAMEEGWVVLPVHDSFITTDDKCEELKNLMIGSWKERLDREPSLKISSIQTN